MKPRVALATCEQFPRLSDDDRPVLAELAALGVDAEPAVWNAKRDWTGFDAVVVRSTWYYWREHERFVGWLSGLESAGVPVWNPAGIVRANIDKRYLRKLAANGFPVAPTAWLEPGGSLTGVMDERGWSEIVVKPVVSGNADLTHRVRRDRAPAAGTFLDPIWRLGPAMVQPFLPSILSNGEYSLIFLGGAFSHAVVKRAASGDFRVQHEHGGVTQPTTAEPAWIALAQRLVAGVGKPLLYARVDLALHEGRPCLMELELTEPFLYLGHSPGAAARFARAIAESL